MPVRARHVAADAARIDADRLEPVDAVADLAQGPDLPGDLVGGDLGVGDVAAGAAAAHAVHRRLGEDHVRMVVGAVGHEPADRGGHAVEHVRRRDRLGEIERVGASEAEQIAIEMHRLVHLVAIVAEMAEAPDLEGPLEQDAADVELVADLGHAIHGAILRKAA